MKLQQRPTSALERSALEHVVLVLGIASSACLAVAAFTAFGSPREAGWSHLNDLASSIRNNVRAAWSSVTADVPSANGEPVCLEPASDVVRWTTASASADPVSVERLVAVPHPTLTVFDALLSESTRMEIALDKPADALPLAELALVKEADAAWIAQARLRAIQLAAQLGRGETVREHWAQARGAMDPRIVTGDTSTLLLCLLAALPFVDEADRATSADPVVAQWTSGTLPVPGPPPRMERVEHDGRTRFECAPDARENALRALLFATCGEQPAWAAQFGELDAMRRRDALRALVGKLPIDVEDARAWSLHPAGGELLAVRAEAPGTFRGHMLLRSTLDSALQAQLETRRALPEGFALDMNGDSSGLGEPVGAWMDLGPAFSRVTVRHPDVVSILRQAESRTLWLRAGLLVLAVFVAGASLATSYSLRRERRLVEARTSFVAGVSHELRTPLASILLMAENLENGRAGANLERYHASIKREALRLRRLVDDVLDFSRLERGKRFEARIEDVDTLAWFEAVAAESVALGSQLAESSGTHVTSTHGPLPAHGAFDREALRRAVLNLVDNALKHSGAKSVRVHAELREPGLLALVVSDDGKGIPNRHRATVFDPFTRLPGTESTPGAGLGLAIVREIALAHGGQVTLRDPLDGLGVGGIAVEILVPLGARPHVRLEAAS